MTDFDIYTNRVSWGLLTDDEKEQLISHNGPLMKYDHIGKDWVSVPPGHEAGIVTIYRAAPKKPEIPWEHIHPRWNAWAIDKLGIPSFYREVPKITSGGWFLSSLVFTLDNVLAIDTTGVDWRDSLVIRPGYEADNA